MTFCILFLWFLCKVLYDSIHIYLIYGFYAKINNDSMYIVYFIYGFYAKINNDFMYTLSMVFMQRLLKTLCILYLWFSEKFLRLQPSNFHIRNIMKRLMKATAHKNILRILIGLSASQERYLYFLYVYLYIHFARCVTVH